MWNTYLLFFHRLDSFSNFSKLNFFHLILQGCKYSFFFADSFYSAQKKMCYFVLYLWALNVKIIHSCVWAVFFASLNTHAQWNYSRKVTQESYFWDLEWILHEMFTHFRDRSLSHSNQVWQLLNGNCFKLSARTLDTLVILWKWHQLIAGSSEKGISTAAIFMWLLVKRVKPSPQHYWYHSTDLLYDGI